MLSYYFKNANLVLEITTTILPQSIESYPKFIDAKFESTQIGLEN